MTRKQIREAQTAQEQEQQRLESIRLAAALRRSAGW